MKKTEAKSLSIVIPIYNEAQSIDFLLKEYQRFTKTYDFELICVNNGSTDDTRAVLQSHSKQKQFSFIHIVTIKKNIGYGHGLMTGIKQAKTEVVAWTHADMQTSPADVFAGYEVYKGKNDKKVIVKGKRRHRPYLDRIVSATMALIASILLRERLSEINAQPKVFHASIIPFIKTAPTDFSFDLFFLFTAKKHGYTIHEIPVRFFVRTYGVSKWAYSLSSRWKTILSTLSYIVQLSQRN